MVKVIQKNINDISYSTFRLVDIYDPLMMYYIVKNFDGSYENVLVDKVKKTHKYKSFRKKYNDIKELNDVAIVDKKLRVKHKSNDEYKYVFLEDGNKLRIMISSMTGGTTRKLSWFLNRTGQDHIEKNGNSAQTSSDANSGVGSAADNGSVISKEGQGENEVNSEESEGQGESEDIIIEEYFSPANKRKRNIPELNDIDRDILSMITLRDEEKDFLLGIKRKRLENYNKYEAFLKKHGVMATIGKSINDMFYNINPKPGSVDGDGFFDVLNAKLSSYFDSTTYNYQYKDTKIFKKMVLNFVLYSIHEITKLKLIVENFLQAHTLSGSFIQCGGRNSMCDRPDPIFCNLRDRLVRDIIHDFKGHRSNIPSETVDTFIQMFSKNGSEISFENSENYTYGSTKNSLADVEKSYREIIMRKCLDYDLLHFIMIKVKNNDEQSVSINNNNNTNKKTETGIQWEESFLYKVYGDQSKDVVSYTTDNNISNKIKRRVPVDKLEFYYTVAGIFDPEINQTDSETITNRLLSVTKSLAEKQLTRTTKNLNEDLKLDLRIMNSISIKYSDYSFTKENRPRTDENLGKFLQNVYLHFESLSKENRKFVFTCKFVYHYGNVGVDGMNLNKTDFNKEKKKKY